MIFACICNVEVDVCERERERMRLLHHTILNTNVCIFPSIFIHFRRQHQYIDIGIHIDTLTHALPNKKKNVKRKERREEEKYTEKKKVRKHQAH